MCIRGMAKAEGAVCIRGVAKAEGAVGIRGVARTEEEMCIRVCSWTAATEGGGKEVRGRRGQGQPNKVGPMKGTRIYRRNAKPLRCFKGLYVYLDKVNISFLLLKLPPSMYVLLLGGG